MILLAKKNSDEQGSVEQAAGSSELVIATAEIESMSYDKTSHSISLKLNYGGCEATKHVLKLNDVCLESYPMQCSATLSRPKSFNSSCKMAIKETVSLVLEKAFDTSWVSVTTGGKTSQVLVDRTGKIPSSEP
ncbi:MAG: hypothetical protein EOP09_10440 [Proteobacteria bacterium]|nr:MAG: hypothetical protein EOP09_10440 [Pseudomonadota bacterium]